MGWRLVWVVGLATLLSLTEGVSLGMVFPLIAVLGDPAHPGARRGAMTERLLHALAATHVPQGDWLAALLVLLLLLLGVLAALSGLLGLMTIEIVVRTRERLGARLYGAILHADWDFLTRRKSSDLTHYLSDELMRVGGLTAGLLGVASNGLVALLLVGVALYTAPVLTLLLLGLLLVLVPWQRRTMRRIAGAGTELSTRLRAVFESTVERVQSLKVIKAYGAERAELALFTGRSGAVGEQLLGNEVRRNWSSQLFQGFSTALLCGLILLGLGPLQLGAGKMLIFLFAFLRAMPRIAAMQGKLNDAVADLPAFGHIEAFLGECGENAERDEPQGAAPELRRELRLERVAFRYAAGAAAPVLRGLDLRVEAGTITALAGSSGAGKSTIADLMLGVLVPQEGSVTVDGTALTRGNVLGWRRQIGYVSQDTLLFHASVRENLLWARPEASEAELLEALRAGRAEFVFALAQGLETVVGDRGTMLSHGQQQRIALARALLLKPRLLILDEATNSLDLENEEMILRTVREQKGLTTVLISHRPSALCAADVIYVLEKGSVRARGTWEEVRSLLQAERVALQEGASLS